MQFVTEKIQIRKPVTDLYVNGSLTKDREAWKKERQRHFEKVWIDHQETAEEQEKRLVKHKKLRQTFYGRNVRKQIRQARRFNRKRHDQTVATIKTTHSQDFQDRFVELGPVHGRL